MLKILVIAFMAAALASCVTAAQSNPGPSAAILNSDLTGADLTTLIANDQQLVQQRLRAAGDRHIRSGTVEAGAGEDILAKQDKVRARAWSQKNACCGLGEERGRERSAAKARAMAAAAGNIIRSDPCRNAMGQNICRAPGAGNAEPRRHVFVDGGGGTVGQGPC